MAKTKYVTIEKDGEQGQIMPASISVWEKNGWTVVDDGSSEADDTEQAEELAPVPEPGDGPVTLRPYQEDEE